MVLSPLMSIASEHFHKFIHPGKGSVFPIPDKPGAKGCTTDVNEDEMVFCFLTYDNGNDKEASDDTDALDHFDNTPSPKVLEVSVVGDMLMYQEFCTSVKDGDVGRSFEVIKVPFACSFIIFLI